MSLQKTHHLVEKSGLLKAFGLLGLDPVSASAVVFMIGTGSITHADR